MKIEDGKGKSGDASVSSSQRLNVSAKTRDRMFYVSRDEEQAYNAVMPTFSAAAGTYVFYIMNTSSTKNMFLHSLEYHSVENVQWKVFSVISGTAAGGTVITPTNLNLSSGRAAEASCLGGGSTITGLTVGPQIGTHRTQAFGEAGMNFGEGLILGPNNAVVVEYDTGTTGLCEIDCIFHFETIGAT